MHKRLNLPLIITLVLFLSWGCSNEKEFQEEFRLPDSVNDNENYTLTIGRVPSETVMDLLWENSKLIKFLNKKLNVSITYSFAENYKQIIQGMSENRYDVVWLGPYAYILSTCNTETSAQYKPIARPARSNSSGPVKPNYRGIIFTHKNSEITKISDIKGKSIAFVDPRSASGYLFPFALMKEKGINFSGNSTSFQFLNGHDKVVRAVSQREYDVGATYEGARRNEMNPKNSINNKLPVLAHTDPIPSSPIALSQKFRNEKPDIAERFKNLMLNLHLFPKGKKALEELKIRQYQEARSQNYEKVRTVISQSEINSQRLSKGSCNQLE